jgi:Phage integrase, N-terminal SAM-like domain
MVARATAAGDLPGLIKSFERHLRAANRSPRTIEKYVLAANQLTKFMAEQDGPLDVADVKRRDVEAYISFLLERYKPGTALTATKTSSSSSSGRSTKRRSTSRRWRR